MTNFDCEFYWDDIPVGKENAVTYEDLIKLWNVDRRKIRYILHELSAFDNGDDYILVRSSSCKGFFKTDDIDVINAYRKECLNKGKSVFAPVKKINRVLRNNTEQYSFSNNLRVVREEKHITQKAVCEYMQKYDNAMDVPMLSKMENGVCLPTPFQLAILSEFYKVEATKLINTDLY